MSGTPTVVRRPPSSDSLDVRLASDVDKVDDLQRSTVCFDRTAHFSMSVGYADSFFAISAT